jgi:flagellar hook-associated protein 2
MPISVGGLASGLDVDGIINQLLTLERRSILGIQRKMAEAEARRAAFNDLDGRLSSLRSATRAFNDANLFRQRSTSSSDASVVTVTAGADALDGRHTVEVLRVATTHRVAAQGFVDESATAIAAADGHFRFTVGDGAVESIEVGAGTTLRDLADAINDGDTGVTAAIVRDGSPSNPYRLVLTSETEGAGGTITITENDTSLDFANATIEAATADATNAGDYLGEVTSSGAYTGGADAKFVVQITADGDADGDPGAARFRWSKDGGLTWDDNGGDGYEVTSAGPITLDDGVEVNFTAGGTLRAGDTFRIDTFVPTIEEPQDALIRVNGINIVKSSNTIDDVFDGLTFNLEKAAAGQKVTLTVSSDVGDVETKLMAFVGAYNSVVGFLNAQFTYDPQNANGAAPPPLNGDSAARQVQRALKTFVTGRIPGLSGATISSLSELGVASDEKTGLLSLDAGKLSSVLDEDPDAVERVLTGFGERVDGDFTFVRRSATSRPGTYEVRVTQARTRAEVTGGAAAQVLAGNEQLTITYNDDAGDAAAAPKVFTVDLLAGDTAEQQVTKLNQAFEDEDVGLTAFLDANGRITVRAREYGSDYSVAVQSDTAAGAGTTSFGVVAVGDTGTDLVGTIGGLPARVLDGNHLKGSAGFATADIEVLIPDDTAGLLGRVRIADGLGEALPDVIDGLSRGTGILRSRTDGIADTIENLEAQLEKQGLRVEQVEGRLRRQFTRLEVTLGSLQALGDYVSQQLSALNANKK